MEDARVWLRVPFAEKEQASRLGAIWCPDRGRWFVPGTLECSRFGRWMSEDEPPPEEWNFGVTAIANQRGRGWRVERRRVGQRDFR